jgi:RNA polymerase sigma-70 factor, ECF subfamily
MTDGKEQDREDIATVQSVLSGNRNAFRQLVLKYQPAVSAVGRRTLRGQEELGDFVQDVFVKAYTHLDQFSGKGRFKAWLMQIAYTTAINRNRRSIPEIPTDPELLEQLWYSPREREPDRVTERSVLWEAIVTAIRDLPGHLALSVELFFVLQLRYPEIAEMTGVPVNTLKSHVRRARRVLQQRLGHSLLENQDEM